MARYASAGVFRYFRTKVSNKRNAKKRKQEETRRNFRKGFVHSNTGNSERVRTSVQIDKHTLPTHGSKKPSLSQRIRSRTKRKSKEQSYQEAFRNRNN